MSTAESGDVQPGVTSPDGSVTKKFSSELDGAFNLAAHPQVAGLVESVQEKKQTIQEQSEELRALDAKLKATEDALQEKTGSTTGSGAGASSAASAGDVPDITINRASATEDLS